MGEGVGADDRLVGLHGHARDALHEVGGAGELGRDDAGMRIELVAVHPDRHDDLLERGVARALAEAVDRALDLPGAVTDAGHRESGRHAEVVVGVDRDRDVLDADDVVGDALDAATEVLGELVAGGVGDVDDGRARVDDRLDHALEERLVGAAGVLGVELHVIDVALGVLDAVHGALDALVLGDVELLVEVLRRHAEPGVDAGALGGLQCLGGTVDVLLDGAREADDDGIVPREAADLLHGAEVARGRDGKAGLDDVDVHAEKLLGDDELLLGVHARTGALLAVAKRGVKDVDLAGHVVLLSVDLSLGAIARVRWDSMPRPGNRERNDVWEVWCAAAS